MAAHATLRDAILYFSDYANCHTFMADLRWPTGKITCPICGAEKVTYLAKRRVWKCYSGHVSPTFSLKTGTIFEDSPVGLEKWLPATWLLLNAKNGISSWELHRALGVTQKTAWFMLQRIRLASQDETHSKLAGEVEVDETFIGGKARNMHASDRAGKIKGRGPDGKAIVAAVLERGGKVSATSRHFATTTGT
jgi:transposase-like protein